MGKTATEWRDWLHDDAADQEAVRRAELDAAQEFLAAPRSDLEQLFALVENQATSSRQITDRVRRAFARLQELRELAANFVAQDNIGSDISALLEKADQALRSGEQFSIADAAAALDQALPLCAQDNCDPEILTSLLSAQALLAAIRQDYRRAAQHFAKAAAAPGLKPAEQWQLQTKRALALQDLGHEFRDNEALEEAVALFENDILQLAPQVDHPLEWAATQDHLGYALGILGQRHRGTWMLEKAVRCFLSALAERTRERVPLDWAATQNNLGNAYGALGQRQGDTELLSKAIASFEAALEERSREKTPLDWATTQNNLGAALHALGVRRDGTKLLSKSVAAYTNVLEIWTRQKAPLEWATTMNNLGTVLRNLGERQSSGKSLEKSVAAFKNALQVRTRSRVPQDWAMTQNNLGAALQKLAESKEDGTSQLQEAISAYENALKVWSKDNAPMTWAMTMANLAVARRNLAERAMDADLARRAADELQAVVDVFRAASHAQYVELGEEQLAKAKAVIEGLLAAQ